MAATAKKTDPALWRKVKAQVTRGTKGGRAGQWSARKAQIAVAEYKARGGGYSGAKKPDNHLAKWTKEDWGTASGRKSRETGERYLPRKARASLSKEEYAATTRKKRADTRKGQQFSAQPKKTAKKTAAARKSASSRQATRAELYARAQRAGIVGRSRMTRAQLQSALNRKRA
ncbi:MAG: hypothetical protein K2X62_03365 [Beijerinckiaceae bacterium]|jgi:hypothetical protein|nr:hypothetical protein [Beijerinckiaceae bacterium]MDO9439256.1 hypothetical protein [Beijerinckiaceae bacterium]